MTSETPAHLTTAAGRRSTATFARVLRHLFGFPVSDVAVDHGAPLPSVQERVRFVDAEFEEADGSLASIDTDLVGDRKTHGRSYAAGPIATLASGSSRRRVW